MRIPLEINWRNIRKDETIEAIIFEKAEKLQQVCDTIDSCRVTMEKPLKNQKNGRRFDVGLQIKVPQGNDIVVKNEAGKGEMDEDLGFVIRNVFQSAWMLLSEFSKQQRGEIKSHPANDTGAVVCKLLSDDGYGFLRTLEGREIYFHRNSVLNDDFDRLGIGTGVRFIEHPGEKGPMAGSVRIVDKPG